MFETSTLISLHLFIPLGSKSERHGGKWDLQAPETKLCDAHMQKHGYSADPLAGGTELWLHCLVVLYIPSLKAPRELQNENVQRRNKLVEKKQSSVELMQQKALLACAGLNGLAKWFLHLQIILYMLHLHCQQLQMRYGISCENSWAKFKRP